MYIVYYYIIYYCVAKDLENTWSICSINAEPQGLFLFLIFQTFAPTSASLQILFYSETSALDILSYLNKIGNLCFFKYCSFGSKLRE